MHTLYQELVRGVWRCSFSVDVDVVAEDVVAAVAVVAVAAALEGVGGSRLKPGP
jgi:hypothetical protein